MYSVPFVAPGSTHEFNIYSKKVRDNIIIELKSKFPGDKIVGNLIKHIEGIDSKILDKYNEITIILANIGYAELLFHTSRVDYAAFEYTITGWNTEIPYEQGWAN